MSLPQEKQPAAGNLNHTTEKNHLPLDTGALVPRQVRIRYV
jgi:hypothetical protein